MATRLRSPFQDYEIKFFHEVKPDEAAQPFPDVRYAEAFLRGYMGDYFAMATLRTVAAPALAPASVGRLSDEQVVQRVAWHLATGHLKLVPIDRKGFQSGAGNSLSDLLPGRKTEVPPATPVGDPVPLDGDSHDSRAAPAAAPTSWITFEVLDEETGAPLPGIDLRLKLPDGTVQTFTTDPAGAVHLSDLPGGTCDIEQLIDEDALEVVRFE